MLMRSLFGSVATGVRVEATESAPEPTQFQLPDDAPLTLHLSTFIYLRGGGVQTFAHGQFPQGTCKLSLARQLSQLGRPSAQTFAYYPRMFVTQ